jgi:anti-sigma factor RsiW
MNRDCSTIFALLSAYLDRDLPPGDCAELEQHIQSCAPCVAFVESLKQSITLGQAYTPQITVPDVSPETKQSLRQAYDDMLRKRGDHLK